MTSIALMLIEVICIAWATTWDVYSQNHWLYHGVATDFLAAIGYVAAFVALIGVSIVTVVRVRARLLSAGRAAVLLGTAVALFAIPAGLSFFNSASTVS
jgi:hypothetical protein